MRRVRSLGLSVALLCAAGFSVAAPKPVRSSAEVIAAAPAGDWRAVDAQNLLVMELGAGRVMIELAPQFAPQHAENIRVLARTGYYDGLAILRVHDNFVTQWGDPEADEEKKDAKPKSLAPAKTHLPAEFFTALRGLKVTRLKERDAWAPIAGWNDGFAVGADPKRNQAWLAHCYGTVGAGRGEAVDSSNGAELYAIIGHAPRALDLNITVVGRVLQGIELLAGLPRGGANMGFYDLPEQRVPITRVRLAADLPADARPALQVMRTESASWKALLDARRHRGGWYVHSPGRTELCAASVPVRSAP